MRGDNGNGDVHNHTYNENDEVDEDDEADSDNVPVYYRYPFVKQITAAVRRIGRSKYGDVNINIPYI